MAHENGVEIGEKLLSILAYSDNKALLGSDDEILQSYLDIFVLEAKKVGLRINLNKTKYMTI